MSEELNKHWLVRRSTIKLMWWVGGIVLAVVTVGDVGVHGHAAFGVDGWFGFYSFFGLLACVAMVVFAKFLGAFLKRRDDYYDG